MNLFRRPFPVSGSRDLAALGLAVSGLVLVGPMELFFPVSASAAFGAMVWGFLAALYVLALVLCCLVLRPRLVIYNISADELRPVLADLAVELDPEARWAGDSLVLPRLGVQLYLESAPAMRNVSLVSAGPQQAPQGWVQLKAALADALSRLEVSRNPRGVALLGTGLILASLLSVAVSRAPQTVAHSLLEMFRR
jgi:hypothetical protein